MYPVGFLKMTIQQLRIDQIVEVGYWHEISEWRGQVVQICGLQLTEKGGGEDISVIDSDGFVYDGFKAKDFTEQLTPAAI